MPRILVAPTRQSARPCVGFVPLVAALLLALVPAFGATANDRYLELGPLGGRPNLVTSTEGFLVRQVSTGFNATHTDYPNHLTQLIGPAQTPFPDIPFAADRLPNNDGQIDGAAGDFDGDGISGTVIAYETNQLSLLGGPPAGPVDAKNLRIVITEQGLTHELVVPGVFFSGPRLTMRPLRTELDPVGPNDFAGSSFQYDRSIRVAVGQLDDDPADEIVLAYWTALETVQIAVIDLVDSNDDDLGDELTVFGLESSLQEEVFVAELTLGRGGSIGRNSFGFAIAVGDYDGDLVDEIALVYPKAHVDQGLIEGFNSAEVVIYEFTGTSTAAVEIVDVGQVAPTFTALTGGSIVPSGGGSFVVPFPGTAGSIVDNGTHPEGTTIRLKRVIAKAANLPYPQRANVDRLGAPRESLVVGLHMHQENLFQKWVAPSALVWLRPSRLADDCGRNEGDDEYCLTNSEPVLNHGRVNVANYDDDGSTLASTFCMDAGNLDGRDTPGGDGADEITFMYDPHLFVMRAVPGGDTLKSSDQPTPSMGAPTQSLVNRDRDGQCSGLSNGTETGGACATIGGFNRNTSGQLGQQCSLTITDVNGHQPIQTQPNGALRPEIMLDLREAFREDVIFLEFDTTNAFVIEINPDDLGRNNPHQFQYVAAVAQDQLLPLTNSFALFADLDGDSVMLTEPLSRYTVGVDQPLVFLGAPPIHFDVVEDNGQPKELDPANCFPGFACPFRAEYTAASQSSNTLSHTYTADWYVSNTTSGCVGECTFGLGSKTEFSLTTAYGEQFSKTSASTIAGGTVSQRDTLAGVDEALIESESFEIWEYGILCDEVEGVVCDEDDTVAVVAPAITNSLFDAWPRPDVDFGEYPLTHEGGNMLSYKSSTDMLDYLNQIGAVIYTSVPFDPAFGVAATPTSTRDVFISETTSTDETQGSIFSIDGSVSGSGSIGFVSASTSFSGGYETTDFVSKQAVVSMSDSFKVTLGQLPSNLDRYFVTPVVYLHNGAFVLDYAVDGPAPCQSLDPGCIATNHPNSFFAEYIAAPDPSFRLPLLLDVEKMLGDDTGDRTHRTTEILIRPVDANGDQEPGDPASAIRPGARVELRTRIHNYSLVDLGSPVTVTFFDDDPNQGGTPIGSPQIIQGIGARKTEPIVPVTWDIPLMSQAAFDAARVYAQLTTNANEIHTNNNVAWRKLSRNFVPEPSAGLLGTAAFVTLALLRRRTRCRPA